MTISSLDMKRIRRGVPGVSLLFGLFFLLGAVPLHALSLPELQQKTKQVVSRCSPATVALISRLGTTGTGVVISSGGLILTAAHVIEGVDEVVVIFPDGREEKGEVLGANYTRDAGMVRLVGQGPYPFVDMGEATEARVGDYVVALGHAKGFDPNRRPPVRFGRLIADGKQRFMVSECTLVGGDSGGPLFNLEGQLVGIHSSIGAHLRLNNHVPLGVFKEYWKRLSEGEQWGMLGAHPMADPDMPSLGFSMGETGRRNGVIVETILRDSPAHKAGILPGDRVVRLASRGVESARGLIRELERYKPGERVTLTLVRGGQEYVAEVLLGRRGGSKS